MSEKSESKALSVYVKPKERAQTALMKLAGRNVDVESNSLEYEDEFKSAYGTNPSFADWRGAPGVQIITPAVAPKKLQALIQQNNALGQCIDAMVTNVHETGYDIMLKNPPPTKPGEEEPEDPKVKTVKAFFEEVWPGMSFQQLRKKMGTDKESVGIAYWEILRNRTGDMVMIRPMETKLTRLVLLSEPYDVDVTVHRGDQDVTVRLPMRYRRFVQSIGVKFVFYKEYGCPKLIDKNTGELLDDTPANRLKLYKKKAMGTEVLHFINVEDVDTPYGVPKWYPQMPSVLGSRKAEEHNLDYFEAGGVPPLMIFIQGGQAGPTMKTALEEFLSSKPGAKQGAPVFEILSTGGTLDNPGSGAKVTVERFGSERQQDSMFENYDAKCEERIRRAWRLPPIFVGLAQDYNLATAQASYAVAEAQVFKPERDEFDNVMNSTILRELDPTGEVIIRSRGLPVKDVNQQLLALQTAMQAGGIDIEELIRLLNEITALNMVVRPTAKDEQQAQIDAKLELGQALVIQAKNPQTQTGNGPSDSSKKPNVKKADALLADLSKALNQGKVSAFGQILADLQGMDPSEMAIFKQMVATKQA